MIPRAKFNVALAATRRGRGDTPAFASLVQNRRKPKLGAHILYIGVHWVGQMLSIDAIPMCGVAYSVAVVADVQYLWYP